MQDSMVGIMRGYIGKSYENKITPFAEFCDSYGIFFTKVQKMDFCTTFIFYCAIKAYGIERGLEVFNTTRGNKLCSCTEWISHFKSLKKFSKLPKKFSVVFFKTKYGKHVEFVTWVGKDSFTTIGANIGEKHSVCGVTHSIGEKSIIGFGELNWNNSIESSEVGTDFYKHGKEVAIREKWILGDGSGEYGWDSYITKEQLVEILARVMNK